MSALIMILTAALIIVVVRNGLVAGIRLIADALDWSPKARGQATGFATSAPELVCLVAAGLSGVWEAGLWNIAASNIINASLMGVAVLRYKQFRELFNRRFADELGFAAAAVVIPVVLMRFGVDQSWVLVPVLLGLFVVYQVVDKRLNAAGQDGEPEEDAVGNLPKGLILGSSALIAVGVLGVFLGDATQGVVTDMGVHPAAAGWILGLVTSLPEMISFFAVYGLAKKEGRLDGLADTQEVLDNLTSSNMANLAIVYPVGLAVYLIATTLI
jgi:Ca2+/Na+ antiporter